MYKMANEELRFSFYVPDDFDELPQEDYAKFDIHPSTLHLFMKLVHDKPYAIPISKHDKANSLVSYLTSIKVFLHDMEKAGFKVLQHIDQVLNNRRIDTIYSTLKNIKYATYFTLVHKTIITCSIEIDEINDENDKILTDVFGSIEEF